MSDSARTHRRQPARLPRPWDSPGKNTGVGCFLLQCMKVKSLSHVWLLAIPWTAAYQAPLSMGFSRQEYWSGLPLPSPMHESEVAQSCLTLRDPMDCSLPGSPIHGIFQARLLEWAKLYEYMANIKELGNQIFLRMDENSRTFYSNFLRDRSRKRFQGCMCSMSVIKTKSWTLRYFQSHGESMSGRPDACHTQTSLTLHFHPLSLIPSKQPDMHFILAFYQGVRWEKCKRKRDFPTVIS